MEQNKHITLEAAAAKNVQMYHIAFDIENSTNVFKHRHNDDTKFVVCALACCILSNSRILYDYHQAVSRCERDRE